MREKYVIDWEKRRTSKKAVPVLVCNECGWIVGEIKESKTIFKLSGEPLKLHESSAKLHHALTRHDLYHKEYMVKIATCFYKMLDPTTCSIHGKVNCEDCQFNIERWLVKTKCNQGHLKDLKLTTEEVNQKYWIRFCEKCRAMKRFKRENHES